jgi:hypothetical protein
LTSFSGAKPSAFAIFRWPILWARLWDLRTDSITTAGRSIATKALALFLPDAMRLTSVDFSVPSLERTRLALSRERAYDASIWLCAARGSTAPAPF